MAKAKGSSLAELKEECARTKAAACPDLEERRRKIPAGRFLREWTDAEGAWHLHMRHNPEVGAAFMAALAPVRDRLFNAARAQGRREPSEAYGADALVEAGCGTGKDSPATPSRGRAKVIARVDLPALLRGCPTEGETCEIAGFPVAVSAIRDLIDTADPFLAAVVTAGETVVGVAHLGRRPTAAQQTALEWLYPMCAAEGCTARTRLENDYRVEWAESHLRCSTCWIVCAPTTTTSRPSRAGRSSPARASGPSWPPATPDIPVTPVGRSGHRPAISMTHRALPERLTRPNPSAMG